MDKKKRKTDKFAIWSFVLALVPLVGIILYIIFSRWTILINQLFFVFFIFPVLLPLLSLALGIISLRRIKNNSLLNGKAIAIVGIVLSILQIVVYLLILFIGFFIKVELYG